MSTADLEKLISPPSTRPPPVDWSAVSKKLGRDLPSDYKAFADEYGAGNVGDFIHVWRPAHANKNLDLFAQGPQQAAALRSMKHLKSPYPFYPADGGLLPWGRTDNSDILMWLTTGAPDTWRVIVTDGSDFHETKSSMTGFLVGFLDGKGKCPLFPDDVPSVRNFFPAT